MVDKSSPLFDFAPYLGQREEVIGLIREFASHHAFRSATVEELALEEDFYRRPLRPEDLEFLQFKKPVPAERVSRLPALATQRLLLSLNEVGVARLPRLDVEGEFARFDAFYGERNQVLGARIRPFLEHYGFAFLGNEAQRGEAATTYVERLGSVIDDEKAFWAEIFALLVRNNYLVEGLRFIMIQRWSLAPSRRVAVERAVASGYFNSVMGDDRPDLATQTTDALLARVAEFVGVTRREHSYWQFYLPTSMAKSNLLYALGSRPDRAFALLGAAFVAEAEAIAFSAALAEACPHLVSPGVTHADATAAAERLVSRFARALVQMESRFGGEGIFRTGQGVAVAEKMAERARWDLGEQLKWLSALERFVQFAEKIDKRIADECPDIDRETFVEPRDMCSTTHVHNDHRLVVIRSRGEAPGAPQMWFWGNLGMRHEMKEGDKVLIPDGRLHGSTVVCEECTYDQPIIPEEWIEELLRGLPARVTAAA
ncbi:iron-containing redox enzyme family protein [Paraburkholderia sp. BCC1885]|uniref:iron-containing redox enzyme family protein n=1 Tax=Paraburkholderia sp. BCC1885 TaxID=2562669 RepID=UPI001182EED6|nr:iron-containing redox enzyme family protein [Paraburkholderia sp. BCC1885]